MFHKCQSNAFSLKKLNSFWNETRFGVFKSNKCVKFVLTEPFKMSAESKRSLIVNRRFSSRYKIFDLINVLLISWCRLSFVILFVLNAFYAFFLRHNSITKVILCKFFPQLNYTWSKWINSSSYVYKNLSSSAAIKYIDLKLKDNTTNATKYNSLLSYYLRILNR